MAMKVVNSLTIKRPDDWHLHLRDGAAIASVVRHSAERFGGALIMPNLKPPITTVDQAFEYRRRILMALPEGSQFVPYMTLYLTDNTTPEEIKLAAQNSFVIAAKLYPAGATTNSDGGVTDIKKMGHVFDAMVRWGLPLCVHGEVTDPSVDIFDREAGFVERVLSPIVRDHSNLKIVLEHVTTKEGVDFVCNCDPNVAATITAHHLLMNRNALFEGGLRPHNYCLPVAKREEHRQALIEAAISGNPKFFLGTDSAPHAKGAKEAACGCAGCYTAHAGIELYAEAFDKANALDMLEGFASFYGADFYGLPRNTDTITLVRQPRQITDLHPFGDSSLVPYRAGGSVAWTLEGLGDH